MFISWLGPIKYGALMSPLKVLYTQQLCVLQGENVAKSNSNIFQCRPFFYILIATDAHLLFL